MFMDDGEKLLVHTGNVDSDGKVEVVFNETANCNGLSTVYIKDDDYDLYDDDLYVNHDMSYHLQAIYDYLDITVCGQKKK
ncbi:hypothetical protein Tco_0753377 [Tanacetum coccineum]